MHASRNIKTFIPTIVCSVRYLSKRFATYSHPPRTAKRQLYMLHFLNYCTVVRFKAVCFYFAKPILHCKPKSNIFGKDTRTRINHAIRNSASSDQKVKISVPSPWQTHSKKAERWSSTDWDFLTKPNHQSPKSWTTVNIVMTPSARREWSKVKTHRDRNQECSSKRLVLATTTNNSKPSIAEWLEEGHHCKDRSIPVGHFINMEAGFLKTSQVLLKIIPELNTN